MIIDLTGKKIIHHSTNTTCEFHKAHPGEVYAGCVCSASYWQEIVDDPNPPKKCSHCDGSGIEK
jgi:hypothetical protein